MSSKKDFEKMLLLFQTNNPEKPLVTEKCLKLLEKFNDNTAFYRSCFDDWHFTWSVLVVNKEKTKVLLMHHKKLWMWLQFWGHADGEVNVYNVALRELKEEAWIWENDIVLLDNIFDIHIHSYPAHKTEPKHFHYDIRFLAIGDETLKFKKQESEVNEIKWFDISEILKSDTLNISWDISRMIENL